MPDGTLSWALDQGSQPHHPPTPPPVTPVRLCTSQTLPGPSTTAGLLNPLDSPHHMRQDEESEFREDVVVDRPTRPGQGSFVNCGMKKVGTGVGIETCFPDTPWVRRARKGIPGPGPLCLPGPH